MTDGPTPLLPPPPGPKWPMGVTIFCLFVLLAALWVRLNHRAG